MPEQESPGKLAKPSYPPYGASGGQGGDYVFTDLDHIDRLITKWRTIRDDTGADGDAIGRAIREIVPPADDEPSVNQAKAAGASLNEAQRHNQAMVDYIDGYLAKLEAARAQYAATEQDNTDQLRQVEDDG